MNLWGAITCRNTARAASRKSSMTLGSTYQSRYSPRFGEAPPLMSWTTMAARTETSRLATRARTMARVLGRTKAQSGSGEDSTISWVRRSRSRQTRSPAKYMAIRTGKIAKAPLRLWITIRVTGWTPTPSKVSASQRLDTPRITPSTKRMMKPGLPSTWPKSRRVRARSCCSAAEAPKRGRVRTDARSGAGALTSGAALARLRTRPGRSPKRNRP